MPERFKSNCGTSGCLLSNRPGLRKTGLSLFSTVVRRRAFVVEEEEKGKNKGGWKICSSTVYLRGGADAGHFTVPSLIL